MYSYVVFGFLLSSTICASIGIWLLARNGPQRPGFTFGVFMFVMAFWSATHVGLLSSTTEPWLLAFNTLGYVSVVATPIVWLLFVLRYTDRSEWLSRRRIVLLSVMPLLTLGFVSTAPSHSLFYTSIAVETVDGQSLLVTTAGPWHAVNIAYSYTLLAVGTGLLIKTALTTSRLYRRQAAVLIACSLTPWLANVVYNVGFQPTVNVDPTPLAFTLVGIPFAVVVLRTDLTTFVPIAHERVFRTLDDPVVVVGPAGQILDANDHAQAVLGRGRPLEGSHIVDVLPEELVEDGSVQSLTASPHICSLTVDGETRRYLARRQDIDPELDAGSRGTIVSLTDITVQLDQRDALAEKNTVLEKQASKLTLKNEQLERLAGVVSHDLATPLATGEGLLHLVRADVDDSNSELIQSLDDLEIVHGRLREFAAALPELARESTDVDSPIECELRDIAEDAWCVVDTGELTLSVESTCTLRGDPRRLRQAFENLFQNVVDHASTPNSGATQHESASVMTHSTDQQAVDDVSHRTAAGKTVRVGVIASDTSKLVSQRAVDSQQTAVDADGFYLEDDGPGIPADRRQDLLVFGVSTGTGTGYGLAIVRTIIEAHGWSLTITDAAQGGARFEIRGLGE